MPKQPVLLSKERDVLSQRHGKCVGNIQAGDGTLCTSCLERVLRRKQSVARGASSEDLAHVVQVLAKRVADPQLHLFEQIVGAELCLECMVVRETAIGTGANDAQTAVYASHIRPGAGTHLLGCGAWCKSGSVGNQAREVLQQAILPRGRGTQVGVAIDRLVEVGALVANVTGFPHGVLGDFALEAKAPAVYFVRSQALSGG